MITIESLVNEYWKAREKTTRLMHELNNAQSERSALQQLIIARGGQELIKSPPPVNPPQKATITTVQVNLDSGKEIGQYDVIRAILPSAPKEFTVEEIWELTKDKLPDITRKAITFNLWKLSKAGIVDVVKAGRGRREGSYKLASKTPNEFLQ